MITKRELRKLATLQIGGVIQSMDLETLFGTELYELAYDDRCSWVKEVLTDVQRKAAAKFNPKPQSRRGGGR